MKTLTATQLIYTRVEAPYSPKRRAGFQTVYRSTTLSPSDINAIEQRIQCFQPPTSTVVRRQYFTLCTGAVVVTQTRQIATHPDIIDKTRRAGAFLAHALVVTSADFAEADYNPFVLFDYGPWVQNAEDMVAMFGQATGVAPLVELCVEFPSRAPSCTWSGAEAYKLVMLALHAEQWVRAQHSVSFIGQAADIDEALRMMLYLVPRDQRIACTFDTSIDGCPTLRGLYWAIGTGVEHPGETSTVVSASERRVLYQGQPARAEHDLYLSWLQHVSIQDNFPVEMQHAGAIQLLAAAFAERGQPPLDEIHTKAYTTFINLHRPYIGRRIERALEPTIGEHLATLLGGYVSRRVALHSLLRTAAMQEIQLAPLSALAVDWLIDRRPRLRSTDWRYLQQLARQDSNPRLLHLAATLGDKVDADVRDEALCAMNAPTFQSALEQCMDPIAPADFVTPVHLPLLFACPQLHAMSDAQCLALIAALLQVNATRYLSCLIPHVRRLAHKPLAALEKILKKHSAIPYDFYAAVRRQREALGPTPGWFRGFRK